MHLFVAIALFLALAARGAEVEPYATSIASLIAPTNLATLGARGANPRIQKSVYWLATSRQAGCKPPVVAQRAVVLAGYTNSQAAQLTWAALLRNLDIATKLGCLDGAGEVEMRRGHAPTVQNGPYKGQALSVDHIVPRAVAPELDNVIANLELLPLKANESKNAKIGARQLDLAKKLRGAGLLSQKGFNAVNAKLK
jgi:hypothetical protein